MTKNDRTDRWTDRSRVYMDGPIGSLNSRRRGLALIGAAWSNMKLHTMEIQHVVASQLLFFLDRFDFCIFSILSCVFDGIVRFR